MPLLIAFVAIADPAVGAAPGRCEMTAGERTWIEGAVATSESMRIRRLHIAWPSQPVIVVFNERCRFEKRLGGTIRWQGEPHNGSIRIPDGASAPAGVTSFAGRDDKTGQIFFVMALPSIWEAAKVMPPSERNLGLKAVFLHEFAHVTHLPVLQPGFERAAARFKEPDGLTDDSIQARFKDDPTYVAVIEKERALLFDAAAEPDPAKARDLARQALRLMKARQDRWFTGADAVWKPYDDLFLTMEGVGQWTGYAWLADPQGGKLTPVQAQDKMRGSRRWWSQEEGLALFLVIDRFVPDWPAKAFAPQPALAIDLLEQAVAPPAG